MFTMYIMIIHKVWRSTDGVLCRTLQGHGHWVNVLALNTDYVMRTGAFDPAKAKVVQDDCEEAADVLKAKSEKRYKQVNITHRPAQLKCRSSIKNCWTIANKYYTLIL